MLPECTGSAHLFSSPSNETGKNQRNDPDGRDDVDGARATATPGALGLPDGRPPVSSMAEALGLAGRCQEAVVPGYF